MQQTVFDLVTVALVLAGMLFMLLAAVGLLRMPDIYHRMHAATKGVTLGIIGLALALPFALAGDPEIQMGEVIGRIVLVILFQFVANPVGAHLLSKAAHAAGHKLWTGTLSDELAEDQAWDPPARG